MSEKAIRITLAGGVTCVNSGHANPYDSLYDNLAFGGTPCID